METTQIFEVKNQYIGLPWWRGGWESACRCRGHGFEPWPWRVPHATEQLSPCATTRESLRTATKTRHSQK